MALDISGMRTSIGDFQRGYLYMLFIEEIPVAVRAKFGASERIRSNIDLYHQKGIWPDRKNEDITVKWAGEFTTYSGVDASTREGELVFLLDEAQEIEDFFNACKDLTGDEVNNAAVPKAMQLLTLGVARVSVDKKTITGYRRLQFVKVKGVKSDEPDKEGSDITKLTVEISWDKNITDKSKRGKEV